MIKVEKLNPFGRMCISLGMLPSSYKESMTYEEQLLWFFKFLDETVIPTVNNNAEAVEELQALYIEVKTFVDEYFDNLDVQEEINNKLDDMAESGELADVIAQYLGLAGMLTFNSVADMKLAENLVNGSTCETYGFYSYNDGGGAKYKVRTINNNDIVDEKTIIALYDDTLIAELIKQPKMSILCFGAKGDGTTNDTACFTTALNYCNYILVPKKSTSYVLTKFNGVANTTLEGIGKATLTITGTNELAPLVGLKTNCTYKNIIFNCTAPDVEWNRGDLQQKTDVNIIGCTFTGFLNPTDVNSWGLYLDQSERINIVDCYFNNNSQSDIAIVENCSNIYIKNCDGTSLHINLEPNNKNPIKDVIIEDCNIARIDIQENSLTGTSIKNLSLNNNTITDLYYDGGTTTINNCIVSNYHKVGNKPVCYGGILEINNSAVFSGQLLDDPYFDDLRESGGEWLTAYNTSNKQTAWNFTVDEDGCLLQINNNNSASQSSNIKSKKLTIDTSKIYICRVNSKTYNPTTGSNYISQYAGVAFYDNSSTLIGEKYWTSLNRTTAGNYTPMTETCFIIEPPTGAVTMELLFCNSSYGTQSVWLRSCELYEIKGNSADASNSMIKLPVRKQRTYTVSSVPSDDSVNHIVGDKIYFSSPSTYIGSVCTVAGRPGTWKSFGALEE